MDRPVLDIADNRSKIKYKKAEQVRRILWSCAYPFFRFSPRICFRWRCFLLRLFGAKVGCRTNIYSSANIYMPWNLVIGDDSSIGEWVLVYNLGLVTIGNRTTISQRAHLCGGTHDFSNPSLPLQKLPITINNEAWVCADAFVGPGVEVGTGAIVGARAVVTKDVPNWSIVIGNPAQILKKREIINPDG